TSNAGQRRAASTIASATDAALLTRAPERTRLTASASRASASSSTTSTARSRSTCPAGSARSRAAAPPRAPGGAPAPLPRRLGQLEGRRTPRPGPRVRGERKEHGEGGAAALPRALRPDGPAVQLYQLPRDGQPQAETALRPRDAAVAPPQPGEDVP